MIRRNLERKEEDPGVFGYFPCDQCHAQGLLGCGYPKKGANLGRERPWRRCVRPRMLRGRLTPVSNHATTGKRRPAVTVMLQKRRTTNSARTRKSPGTNC
ncbi:MAG: hypothetical protein Ct9H300mP11_03990 [Chloroflexota bacterium]|nr:MAG: hypothetical protein Ct9H300mP11_03990 [Chloroflexota bacterium]